MKENKTKQTVTVDIDEFMELCRAASADKDRDSTHTRKQAEVTSKNTDSQLDLLEMAKVLLKKWWLIAIVTIVVASLAFVYFYSRVTVTYCATAKMFVNNSNISLGSTSLGGITVSQIGSAGTLINSYVEIMKTRKTLNAVSRELYENYGYQMDYYELYNMVKAGSVDGTVIFFIQVHHSDPKIAIDVANAVVNVLPAQIEAIVNGASAKVVDYAEDAVGFSSDVKKKTLIVAVGAFILSSLAVILKDYILNDMLSSAEWLTQVYSDLPILAEIPDVNAPSAKEGKYYKYYYYRSNHKKE